jgi:ABC-type bacteriocin/lantibiotic exporter with double-glycine peptidase domain
MTKTLKIPHVKQINEASCGAAALAMVYTYFKVNQTQEGIWKRLAKPRQDGSGLVIYTKSIFEDVVHQGLSYVGGQVVWRDKSLALGVIKRFLDIGVPVIVNQLWKEHSLYGHYSVVVGMDDINVVVQDPMNPQPEIEITHDSFMHKWNKIPNSKEVPGGVFVVIFPKEVELVVKNLEFTLVNLAANISQFKATDFEFDGQILVKGGES